MASPILRHFTFQHLSGHLQSVSRPICELARAMDDLLPDGAEKSAGLRKLLEAKDALVRAKLEEMNDSGSDGLKAAIPQDQTTVHPAQD